ncbi:hypothetical protein [Planctomicrobium sp. SH664]
MSHDSDRVAEAIGGALAGGVLGIIAWLWIFDAPFWFPGETIVFGA